MFAMAGLGANTIQIGGLKAVGKSSSGTDQITGACVGQPISKVAVDLAGSSRLRGALEVDEQDVGASSDGGDVAGQGYIRTGDGIAVLVEQRDKADGLRRVRLAGVYGWVTSTTVSIGHERRDCVACHSDGAETDRLRRHACW